MGIIVFLIVIILVVIIRYFLQLQSRQLPHKKEQPPQIVTPQTNSDSLSNTKDANNRVAPQKKYSPSTQFQDFSKVSDSPTSKQTTTQVDNSSQTSNSQRPYLRSTTDTLTNFADTYWNDPQVLQDLYQELNFRSRQKAKLLQQKIEQRLQELTSFSSS